MKEYRINYIDRKDSKTQIIVDVEFCDVVRDTRTEEGETIEYVVSSDLISASSFLFVPDYTEEEIYIYLQNYLEAL